MLGIIISIVRKPRDPTPPTLCPKKHIFFIPSLVALCAALLFDSTKRWSIPSNPTLIAPRCYIHPQIVFSVQNSSIGDLVCLSVCPLSPLTIRVFTTLVQSDPRDFWDIWSEWWAEKQKLKKTNWNFVLIF